MIEEHGLRRVEPAPRNLLQYEPVRELYRGGSPIDITLVRKDNGGRADALNAGLDLARHPYVCVTDADSILDPDGADGHDAAGAGGSRARDRRRRAPSASRTRRGSSPAASWSRACPAGHLARFQVVEYLRAFLYGRVAWDCDRRALHRLRRVRPLPPRRRRGGRRLLGRHGRRGPRADGAPAPAHARPGPPLPDHVRARSRCAGPRRPPTWPRSEASGAAGTAACGSACGGTAR